MDSCKDIKDWILTDYIDGEMDAVDREKVDGHLKGCASCRAFLEEVQGNMQFMSAPSAREPVPEYLWSRVRERLVEVEEKSEREPAPSILEHVLGWVVRPWFVPALAGLLLVVIIGAVTTINYQMQQAQKADQVEYLASLVKGNGAQEIEPSDVEVLVEKYFL